MGKILLVDDEEDIIFLTKRILETEGHEVPVARSGRECLRMIKRHEKPDLILLDIMMPGEDGWEVCRKLKSDNDLKDVPVAVFTVRTSKESVKKSREFAHADAQINKPFKSQHLLEVVDRLIKKT